jgi:putative transposase
VGGIVGNLRGTLLKAGSVADHIHLLIAHPRTIFRVGLSDGDQDWVFKVAKDKESGILEFPLAKRLRNFFDQPISSFGARKIHRIPSRPPSVVTFQEEYRRLLEKYDVSFDERFIWD